MIVMNALVAGYDRQPVTRPLSGVIERGSMTAIIGAAENPRRIYSARQRQISLAG